MKQLAISQKLWLSNLLTALGLIALTLLALGEYRKSLANAREHQLHELLEAAYTIRGNHHQQPGERSTEAAHAGEQVAQATAELSRLGDTLLQMISKPKTA